MRIITKDLRHNLDNISNSTYLLTKNFLLLDIETTGFSRENEIIYMIGCIYKIDSDYKYLNIFAETPSQEGEVLEYFFNLVKNIDCMIHFNGNRFDLPFLLARANKHGIKDEISHMESIDIYELLRPLRTSLRFPDLKLDTVQAQLGYNRKDLYNGGDLIQIYQNYTQKPYEPYYELLLLHNREDVEGMINLLPLIDIRYLIDDIIRGEETQYIEATQAKSHIKILYQLPHKVFIDFKLFSKCDAQLILSKHSATAELLLPIHQGEKKLFLENYKDYMYMIEDNEGVHKNQVMHKTVANFVPSDKKRKAKKAECYISHTGFFIPIFLSGFNSKDNIRIFKDTMGSKEQYVLASDGLGVDFYHNQIMGFLKESKGIK